MAEGHAAAQTELAVAAGHISALRLFDIAYAIDLSLAERLWTCHAAGSTARSRLHGTPPKAVSFGVPPLAVGLESILLALPDGPVAAQVTARLYDFGAVTLALRISGNGLEWSGFSRLMNAVSAALRPGESDPWRDILAQLRRVLAPALVRPNASAVEEDYLLAIVHAFDARPTAAELLERVDLVPLLSGEQRRLSDAARAELLQQRFSYFTDDLVVLTWDRAFIYEPRGDSDVADVVEVANAQLLEMRYYDELLDAELPRMYDLVEAARRRVSILGARRYARLARRLYATVAEVTELAEKVDNALQVTEDVYLARIYAAALNVFRVRTVSAAVDRKLAIVRDTYTALYDEASGSRAELMEIAVIALIALEIMLALWRR
jgi:hypothetical protein